MKVSVSKQGSSAVAGDLVAVVATRDEVKALAQGRSRRRRGVLTELDDALDGQLEENFRRENFQGKLFEVSVLPVFDERPFHTVLAIGWETKKSEAEYDRLNRLRKLGAMLCRHGRRLRAGRVVLNGATLSLDREGMAALQEGFILAGYRFDRYKSKRKSDEGAEADPELAIAVPGRFSEDAVAVTAALCAGTALARDLVNTPPRDCTPTHLMQTCRDLARTLGLKAEVYDRTRLKSMGANALLAVAQGSDEPPYLIKLTYRPKVRPKRVISIVGKGITFDSGGLSIKPGASMETMKYDMAGAAAVIGAMQAIGTLRPNVEVRAYIPTTENMISGSATRPGDVVTAMNGKTIEILNTDAEGRLILADALCLAERDRCDVIIDLATLTGAVVVALGPAWAGLFTEHEKLAQGILSAAERSGERFWRLPLAPEYRDLIKSSIADLKNTGGRWAGAITAALFLKEFVAETPWAHLDIAGPSFAESEDHHLKKGGVGFGVRTLVRYILDQ